MSFNTDAVVLKSVRTGESDKLLFLLTRDMGVIRAFAKSAARPKNKLHSCSGLFCYGNFSIYEGAKYMYVRECDLKEIFFSLRDDISDLALAQYFNELLCDTVSEGEDSNEILRLYLNTLHFLSNKKLDRSIIKPMFEMRLLSILGFMPDVVGCAVCGRYETDVMGFDPLEGRLFCSDHAGFGALKLDIEAVRAMRHIVLSELPKMFTLRCGGASLKNLSEASEKYTLATLQRSFPTLSFYKTVM